MVAFLIFYWIFSALVVCGKFLAEGYTPRWIYIIGIMLSPLLFPFWLGYFLGQVDK